MKTKTKSIKPSNPDSLKTLKTLKALKAMLSEAMDIADQAITLADAYAGGESETCDYLKAKFSKLENKINKQ